MIVLDGKYQKAGLACQPARLTLVDRILAAISPWTCVLCRQPAAGMDCCIDCLNDLPWVGRACGRCARPLREFSAPAGPLVCGSCAGNSAAPDTLIAGLIYEYPVTGLVTALKYRRNTELARVLGELLAIAVREALVDGRTELPDALVPIPLHPFRQFRRGFNQAELIARVLGRELGLPICSAGLKRIRHTPHQTGLGSKARQRNVRGCFAARTPFPHRRVAIIDDVVTTGATLRAAVDTLRIAGCNVTDAWIAAVAG